MYFYATRKRRWALGVGVLASLGSVVATAITLTAFEAIARLLVS